MSCKRWSGFCRIVGYPKAIRVDQGSEFISRDLDLWAYQRDVTLDFSRPGKPTDNSLIETFNGKLRVECLNTHWFMSLDDARLKLEDWRRDYNEIPPHSADIAVEWLIGALAGMSLTPGKFQRWPPPS
jgi:putative transposase